MSPVGLTKDVGWNVGASRTVPHDPEHVWATLLSPEGLAIWVGPGATLGSSKGDVYETTNGTTGELRTLHPGDRIRLTWQPTGRAAPTTLQVVIRPGARGTSVRFHQDRLADAGERAEMKAHWRRTLDRLEGLLAS